MICEKCKKEFNDKYIQRHHELPFSIFHTYNCKEYPLCRWCHRKIHNELESLGYTTEEKIKEFTKLWIEGKNITIEKEEIFPLCPKCKDYSRRLFFLKQGKDYLILFCPICGYVSEKDYHSYTLWQRKVLREESINKKRILFGYVDNEVIKDDII